MLLRKQEAPYCAPAQAGGWRGKAGDFVLCPCIGRDTIAPTLVIPAKEGIQLQCRAELCFAQRRRGSRGRRDHVPPPACGRGLGGGYLFLERGWAFLKTGWVLFMLGWAFIPPPLGEGNHREAPIPPPLGEGNRREAPNPPPLKEGDRREAVVEGVMCSCASRRSLTRAPAQAGAWRAKAGGFVLAPCVRRGTRPPCAE